MRVIGQAHTLVHQNGVLRVQTDIRAGTRYFDAPVLRRETNRNRTDKKQHFSEKVTKVESILAADSQVAEKKTETPPETKTPEAAAAKPPQLPSSPSMNKGTWASMFKK